MFANRVAQALADKRAIVGMDAAERSVERGREAAGVASGDAEHLGGPAELLAAHFPAPDPHMRDRKGLLEILRRECQRIGEKGGRRGIRARVSSGDSAGGSEVRMLRPVSRNP